MSTKRCIVDDVTTPSNTHHARIDTLRRRPRHHDGSGASTTPHRLPFGATPTDHDVYELDHTRRFRRLVRARPATLAAVCYRHCVTSSRHRLTTVKVVDPSRSWRTTSLAPQAIPSKDHRCPPSAGMPVAQRRSRATAILTHSTSSPWCSSSQPGRDLMAFAAVCPSHR